MLRLELGTERLDLDDHDNGIIVAVVDPGWPETREEVYALPDRDGVADYTRFMGQRVISLTGTVDETPTSGTRQQILDRLRRYCVPNVRPTLIVGLNDEAPRRIVLRADQHSAPISRPGSAAFACTWRSADPRFYDLEASRAVVLPPMAPDAGRTYDLVFDREYPEGYGGAGVVAVSNRGDVDTWPTFRFYGPLTDPSLTNLDTAEAVAFNIAIADGDYLVVDTEVRAVYLNDDPGADRYANVRVGATTWFPLRPGLSQLRLSASAYTTPAQASIEWTDAYL